MKLTPFRKPSKHHTPLLSFAELAKELGQTLPVLRGHMAARFETCPKPELVCGKKSYYKPDAFRAWFKREVMA